MHAQYPDIRVVRGMDASLDSDGYALAAQTRDVHKFYGTGKNASHVLRGVSIDVPYGSM